ncbi:MAG TPA: ABC transporter permease [Gemmatimonadales bacterium]|nr:ABC transporter permease [Gemmatimonadales bacterium]
MREWLNRLVDMFRRDRLDAELAEELRHHRALATRDGERTTSDLRTREAARDQWSWPWLDQLVQDTRYAARGLRRAPGFAATVALTLGLGIGANAMMFGVLDRLMFKPFAMLRDPATVHRVYIESEGRQGRVPHTTYEYTRYLDLQRWTTSFSQSAGIAEGRMAIGTGEAARERRVAYVNAAFWDFFEARPVAGRFFGPSEDSVPAGAPVVVLSYGYWQAEFGGRNVLGQPLQVGEVLATIIGVAPRGFTGLWEGDPPAAYIPITTYAGAHTARFEDPTGYYTRYNWGWMKMIVRRKPGVSAAEATADLTRALERSWTTQLAIESEVPPLAIAKPTAVAGPLKQAAGPEGGLEAKTARWVMGVAVIVLLIACANVTNLLLARHLRRRRETAVRLALGVSRGRLLRQALTECVMLASAGCVAGIAISQWGGAALRRLFLNNAGSVEVGPDGRTVLVASLVALFAGLVTALGAVILSPDSELTGTLKSGTREGTHQRSRSRSALLVIQGALSVILLVGAGLFVRSLSRVSDMRLGYEPEQVLVAYSSMRGFTLDSASRVVLERRLMDAAQASPAVETATQATSIPFWSTSSRDFFVDGIDSVRRLGRFTYQRAGPEYFDVMRTRIVRGRGFTGADRKGAPEVVVVSESMGRVLWPGQDPLTKCIRIRADTMPCRAIVGIAEDAIQNSMTTDARLRYYLPLDQERPGGGQLLLLRVRGNPSAQLEPVRKALQAVMPGLGYVSVFELREIIADEQRSWRMGATMFVTFGGLALLVAAVGLYGVIGYSVAQRMHELGVRIALGARRKHVMQLVLGQGIRFAMLGVGIGLLVAIWVSRWIEPLLFKQSARDPLTYSVVAGLLILVALAASAGPALKATRADPNDALRSD